jgi:hypothetical protein
MTTANPVVNTINKPNAPAGVAQVVQPPKIANDTPPAQPPAAIPAIPKEALLPQDRVPANWSIVETEDPAVIQATNNQTSKTFTGTPKEFSKYIRS